MGFTDGLSDKELAEAYNSCTETAPSRVLKRLLGVRCSHRAFLRELQARGITLRKSDDVLLDYPDDPTWTSAEWVGHIRSLGLSCACGCGVPTRVSASDRLRGLPKYKKNHRGRGIPLSDERKTKISKRLTGRKMSVEFREQQRKHMLERWEDLEYQKEQSRRMTEVNADPARREVHRKAMLAWLDANPEHIPKITRVNKAWAKANPQKKIDAAKKGHKALAGRGKQSSIERALESALKEREISFVPEWEYRLGVADFKIDHVIVFADGDYWHGPRFPKQQAKDLKQTAYLESEGFRVLRFTGTEIRSNIAGCVTAILEALKP